jgi:hypothetical protein
MQARARDLYDEFVDPTKATHSAMLSSAISRCFVSVQQRHLD